MGRGIDDYDRITLSTLGNGALEEAFQVELDRVLRNIDDPNTADGKREINMKITINPNSRGSMADLTLQATSKLQPDLPVESAAYLGKQGAKPMAWEHNPEQMQLPVDGEHIQEADAETTHRIGGMKR